MDYKTALAKVKYDRNDAIRFIKSEFPRDATAKTCEILSNETVAELLVEAYQNSERGV